MVNLDGQVELLMVALAWALVVVLPVLFLAALVHRLATWPFRSFERVQFFLDVIENGLNNDKQPEEAIREAARLRGRDLDGPFQEVAKGLEQGRTLAQALDRAPRLLPPQITAMLKVGIEIGDLRKVLPVARKVLHDDLAKCRDSEHFDVSIRNSLYFELSTAVATALALILVVQVLGTWVFPNAHFALQELDVDKGVLRPILIDTLMGHRHLWSALQLVLLFAALAWGLVYLAGTERMVWIQTRFPEQAARLWQGLPWCRKRLTRDFTFLLAVLLDAHVPEEKAVALAAAGTASPEFKRRAAAVIQDLRGGLWLPSALNHIDDEEQLHWRWLKPIHRQGGFLAALTGWHDWLESQASQQEQIAINTTQAGLCVCNGVMVGLVGVSVFQFLITMYFLTAP